MRYCCTCSSMATFMALKYLALDDIKDSDLKRELASGHRS